MLLLNLPVINFSRYFFSSFFILLFSFNTYLCKEKSLISKGLVAVADASSQCVMETKLAKPLKYRLSTSVHQPSFLLMASLWRTSRVRWGGVGGSPPVTEVPPRPPGRPAWSCSCCCLARPSCLAGGTPRTAADQCCPTDCSFAERKPVGGKEAAQRRKRSRRERQVRIKHIHPHRGAHKKTRIR